MKTSLILVLMSTALLAACDQKPYQPPVPNTDQGTKLFEPQREALEKAKGVEKTLEQAGQAQQEAARKAGE